MTGAVAANGGPLLVQPLKDLCIRAVSGAFEQQRPQLGQLPDDSRRRVVEGLPLDLPLELVGEMIADEEYWQRRACVRWRNCDTASHGRSWKQLYFERNLQEALEGFQQEQASDAGGALLALRRLMAFSRRFVRNVRVRQLPSRLDPQVVFDAMVNAPVSLTLAYGTRTVGMDYDQSLFGAQLVDCRCLARVLAHTEALVHLDLSDNSLDDDKTLMLASGLADNISITHLDLSHNKISDRGARALARILDASSPLAVLDMSDNQLHAEAGRALGRALRASRGLVALSLRLNRLGNAGCAALLGALQYAPGASGQGGGAAAAGTAVAGGGGKGAVAPLERLNIAANSAGPALAQPLAAALRSSRTLSQVDAGCNALGPWAGPLLVSAVRESRCLAALDVRGCGLGADEEAAIREELLARAEPRGRG